MQLTHIALWTNHLERLRDFYVKYFNGKSNEKYVNSKKGFASYFVLSLIHISEPTRP